MSWKMEHAHSENHVSGVCCLGWVVGMGGGRWRWEKVDGWMGGRESLP